MPSPARTAGSSTSAPQEEQAAGHSRLAALVAAVLVTWAMAAAAALSGRPLFLAKPPITRRQAGFFSFQVDGCSAALATGSWTDWYENVGCSKETAGEFATCGPTPRRHWRFSEQARACGASRLERADARALLARRRLVFAGDSIARNLYAALLRLLADPGQGVVVGHADFQHSLQGGISLQFFWAPYPANLSTVLQRRLAPAAAAAAANDGAAEQGPVAVAQGEAAGGEEAQPKALGEREGRGEAAAAAEGNRGDQATPQGAADDKRQQGQQQRDDGGEEAAAGGAADAEQRRQAPDKRRRRLWQASTTAAAAETAARQQRQDEGGEGLRGEEGLQPDIVVLSATLWHLLHITQPDDFKAQLQQLGSTAAAYRAAAAAAGVAGGTGPRLLLASSTETFPNRMRPEDKRRNMTPANVDAYNQAMEQAGLLAPGGPCRLLDLFPLTRHCGEECSVDGVHSQPEVYDAALQLLLGMAAARERRRALRRR